MMYAFTLLTITTISFRDKQGQNLTETLRTSYDNARLLYNHRVIFTTSLYKSHDARTMTSR